MGLSLESAGEAARDRLNLATKTYWHQILSQASSFSDDSHGLIELMYIRQLPLMPPTVH